MTSRISIATLLLLAAACHHAPAHSTGPVTTLPLSQIVIAQGMDMRPLTHEAPQFPAKLQSRHIAASTVALYIVDTTGRVDMRSVRFGRDADRKVYDAVCDVLARTRYAPIVRDGVAHPALMIMPYTFNFWDTPDSVSAASDPYPFLQNIQRAGMAAAFDTLATRPGC